MSPINVIKKLMRSKANHWIPHLVSEVTMTGIYRQFLGGVSREGRGHSSAPVGPAVRKASLST